MTEPVATRAVLILRVTRESVGGAWRGIAELVGADRRTAVSTTAEIGDLIERSLDASRSTDGDSGEGPA